MAAHRELSYAKPYDLMVGLWSGTSVLYGLSGKYLYSIPSVVAIYWKQPNTVLHYRQDELVGLDDLLNEHDEHHDAVKNHHHALKKIVHWNFDLKITGKRSVSTASASGDMAVAGTETAPGIYLFHLMIPEGHYYNNQYFVSDNERHVIGPFVPNNAALDFTGGGPVTTGEAKFVVSQTFTRVSYDVPDRYRRPVDTKKRSRSKGKNGK